MFQGTVNNDTCLKMCKRNQDCYLAWTDTTKDCKLWSKGVNTSRKAHPTGGTYVKDFKGPKKTYM
jgi:hypothetical protein